MTPETVVAPTQPVAKPKPTTGGPQITRINPLVGEDGIVLIRDPFAVG